MKHTWRNFWNNKKNILKLKIIYNNKKMEIVEIKMYYDVYEKYFGDGFYPYIKENNYELEIQNNLNICKIIFNFKYDSY